MPHFSDRGEGLPTREAAEHLARKLRAIMWRRHEGERTRVDLDSHRVPLDLNALFPIPLRVLRKGFGEAGQEWMWRNWGVRWPIRRVTFAIERRDTNRGKLALFRFLSEAWAPWVALLRGLVDRVQVVVSGVIREVHGLLALMELHASRTAARRGRKGEAVLLVDQDRSLWGYAQIQRGMAALGHAQKLGGGAGNYALQASIAACYTRVRTAEETDWERIVLLYDALMQISRLPSWH